MPVGCPINNTGKTFLPLLTALDVTKVNYYETDENGMFG